MRHRENQDLVQALRERNNAEALAEKYRKKAKILAKDLKYVRNKLKKWIHQAETTSLKRLNLVSHDINTEMRDCIEYIDHVFENFI